MRVYILMLALVAGQAWAQVNGRLSGSVVDATGCLGGADRIAISVQPA